MLKLSKTNFNKARDFILTNARMIERRLFEYHFVNGNKEGVYHAVYAYRNPDGGFGWGMEPDTASPESQPLFTIMALETLDEIGYLNADILLKDFMPYFESITTKKGGVPWMLKPKSDYPRVDHFNDVKEWAALSTTAPLLGLLEKYNVNIPWIENAEAFVWQDLERLGKKHVFCNLCTPRRLLFLEHTKSKAKAKQATENLKQWILEDSVLCKDKTDDGWGLYEKPHSLNYAPYPNHILNPIFPKEMIQADLDELIRRQKPDGRWDTWYGLSEGMKLEWAGIQTLWVLRVLRDYGRI